MTRAALLLSAGLATAQPVAAVTVTEVHYVMGTYFRITAEGVDEPGTRATLHGCFATARALDARFSRFDAHSELSQLNADAGSAVTVSPEMAALLQAALQLQTTTDGAFDVGAGSLTHLWRTAAQWPSRPAITQARALAGADAFALTGLTLRRRPGVSIDLDGIAKGWAVDRCVAQLRASGLKRAFLSFGESSLYGLGAPAGAKGWEVALRDLDGERALGTLLLRNQAASVSAVFGHERQIGATRVGHIINPRTGLPLTSPALAVAVTSSATDAEAFSKALLIDGPVRRASAGKRAMTGALVVRPGRIERFGRLPFKPFNAARLLAAAAEPLR